MADADLAIFLDGNGHVVTRDTRALFTLPPLLRSIVEDLTGPKRMPVFEEDSDEDVFPVEYTSTIEELNSGNDEQKESNVDDTTLRVLWKLFPMRPFLAFMAKAFISAIADRCPGVYYLLGLWLNLHINYMPRNIRFILVRFSSRGQHIPDHSDYFGCALRA